MTERPRIALIHATKVAIEPIETAAKEIWAEAETFSILEEALALDRQKHSDLTSDMNRRIVDLARYAEAANADGVLFTCSSFGDAISRANLDTNIPVMKPNEAMFDDAFSYGDNVTMIYTFPPAAPSMEAEFAEIAKAKGRDATLTSVLCENALEAKKAGDVAAHDQMIADTVAQITNADVILFAQFSMASAAPLAREGTHTPILTSPESAIKEVRQRVGAGRKD
ncbi:arylsulfatase [Amylibacter marinus]|uniref:Arylsulfatase n=1 Tax=Amylibacter marinus TaxID=1475483 RepID=A0ABQ5VV96_9RHOB|nr:hypothetical protein [Amylibacter marinus]GLQ35345.1 arylsulfatase [Amylibacter marinus]